MGKSTPISQIVPPTQQTITTPIIQPVEDNNEDINIEDLVQEKERQSSVQIRQQTDLQNQIDTLKREIEMNKGPIAPPPQAFQQPQQQPQQLQQPQQPQQPQQINPQTVTDSLINKNLILSLFNDVDYFLFVILVFVLIIMYSEHVKGFLFEKLELKNLAYLTSYVQAILSSIIVVLIKKLN